MENPYNEIDDNANLEFEFAQIGFDYKNMLNSARYINNWTILFSAETVFRYIQNEAKKIYFEFTVMRSGYGLEYSIHHIQATLLMPLPNSTHTKIVVSKSYWNYNEPFPTKYKICNDIASILNGSIGQERTWGYRSELN